MPTQTILVVDDCKIVRIAVSRILKEEGYRVILACDGEEALEMLSEKPDLIVLDVNMPRLDGFGFCEMLNRKNTLSQHVPIIFLTSENLVALELLGKEMGAYLKKPVKREELLSVVQERLTIEVEA